MASSESGSDPVDAPDKLKSRAYADPAVRRGMQIGLGLMAVIAGAVFLWYTAQVLLVFFASIFLAVFFSGLGRLLQKHTRFTYPACVAFALIGLLQLVVIVGLIVGPAVAAQ